MDERSSCTVSVVVPVYNAEDTLSECFDSLLSQTFSDFEVLIVDDGSNDNSWNVIERYAKLDARFKPERQKNAGPGAARNRCLDRACGTYVACLDCDDWIDERLLEKAVNKAKQEQADVVVWDAILANQRTGDRCLSARVRIDRCEKGFHWTDDPDHVFQSFQNWPWNKLVRRDMLDENGIRFQEDVTQTEDLMYSARALICSRKTVGIPEALSFYRMAQNESAMSSSTQGVANCIKAFLALKSWLERKGIYDDLERSFVAWALEGLFVNLRLLTSRESYRKAYDLLASSAFDDLGVDLSSESQFIDPCQRAECLSILSLSADDYLFRSFRHEWNAREDWECSSGFRWLELRAAESEVVAMRTSCSELEARYCSLRGEATRLELELNELRTANEELRADNSALLNCAEMRVGSALCRLPRFVQRRLKGRKGGR